MHTKSHLVYSLLALAAFGLPAITTGQGGVALDTKFADIRLRNSAVVTDSVVRLGDIAKVDCADANRKFSLESIDLDSLDPGEQKQISKRLIEIRLQLAGANRRVRILGAESVRVQRSETASSASRGVGTAAANVDKNTRLKLDFAQQLASLVATAYDVRDDAVKVELLSKLELPDGLGQSATLEILTEKSRILGKRTIQVMISDGSQLAFRRRILANTLVAKQILVAHQDLDAGTMLTEKNAVLQSRWFSDHSIRYFADHHHHNRRLRRSISKGDAIRTNAIGVARRVAQPVLVKRNDPVTVVAQKGSIRVTLNGAISLESGKKGEVIRVRNPDNKRTIMAKVVSATEVHAIR